MESRIVHRPAAPGDTQLRVLHLHSGNLFGGVEVFLETLARLDLRPEMLADFALCFPGRLADELSRLGARVDVIGGARFSRPWTVRRARRRLAAFLASRSYDVVVCHAAWSLALFGPVVREVGLPLVLYLHDLARPQGWLYALGRRTRPDLILANSAFTARTAAQTFPGLEVRSTRLPVDLNPSVLAPGDRANRRAQLGAPRASDIVILQASRMQPWKGQSLLLDALLRLPRALPWVCWFAGDAQRPSEVAYVNGLKSRVERAGLGERIRFLGQRQDVRDLMSSADIFCQPNIEPEPFGIVFVEALAAGLPVVTTSAAGGALETVDATCGVVVPPEPAALAEALARLVARGDERDELRRGGLKRAVLSEPSRCIPAIATALRSAVPRATSRLASDERAALSKGGSDSAIHQTVAQLVRNARGVPFKRAIDVGCGSGALARYLAGTVDHYTGCDLVAYEGFPSDSWTNFVRADLNARLPFPDAHADLVVSVEVIEHLENPRAFVRELVRVCRPGGHVIVSTPNQLSVLSKLSFLTRHQFAAFTEAPGLYPAHITALLEEDLRRIARECGLTRLEVRYTNRGRIPLTAKHWPAALGLRGRRFSDNVVLHGIVDAPSNPGGSRREK